VESPLKQRYAKGEISKSEELKKIAEEVSEKLKRVIERVTKTQNRKEV